MSQVEAQTKTYQELQTQDVMILMSQGLTVPWSGPDYRDCLREGNHTYSHPLCLVLSFPFSICLSF